MTHKNKTVLIIDDEETIRDFMQSMLSVEGYNTIEASNGIEALRQMKKHNIDIVITDLVMPEKEGIETIREIKKMYPQCRIIAMSGSVFSNAYLNMANHLGAEKILKKPFKKQELIDILTNIDVLTSGTV
jgi:YesN/AraC family two-component response regulator